MQTCRSRTIAIVRRGIVFSKERERERALLSDCSRSAGLRCSEDGKFNDRKTNLQNRTRFSASRLFEERTDQRGGFSRSTLLFHLQRHGSHARLKFFVIDHETDTLSDAISALVVIGSLGDFSNTGVLDAMTPPRLLETKAIKGALRPAKVQFLKH